MATIRNGVALLGVCLGLTSGDAYAALTFTYQGRFLTPDGTAPLTDIANITFSIYNSSGTCLLEQEVFNGVDLSLMSGVAAVSIGTGTRTGSDPGLTMEAVLSNRPGVLRASAGNCVGGYSPLASDGRILQVHVDIPSRGLSTDLTPPLKLDSVPLAYEAQKLQGYQASDFILAQTPVTQTNLNALTNGSNADALHRHDAYVKVGAANPGFSILGGQTLGLGQIDSTSEASLSGLTPGSVWFNSTTQDLRYYDGTKIVAIGASGPSGGGGGSATNFTGALTGDVRGTQSATFVASVSGVSAANVASGATAANAAASINTAGTLVKRDGSGNFSAGTITATNFVGAFSGTFSGGISGNAAGFTGALGGDVTGTQGATVVSNVGGLPAASVASGASAANSATPATSGGKIVVRDGSGNFSAATIFANLSGNAATATSAVNFTGALSGDVNGTQSATNVARVGGLSAASVASGASAANAAASSSVTGAIVLRDSFGNFTANTITGTLLGAASSASSAATASVAYSVSGPVVASSFVVGASASTGAIFYSKDLAGNGGWNPSATLDSSGNLSLASLHTSGAISASGIITTSGGIRFPDGSLQTSATTGGVTGFTGTLAGDVTGSTNATVVSLVGTQSAANVASGAVLANAATATGTTGAIVRRDAAGNFSAASITAALNGNAATASFANSAGTATSASYATFASSATSASYATSAGTASSAGYATLASTATSAAYATLAGSAASATSAGYATLAGSAAFATSASYATQAGSATFATSATNFIAALVGDVIGTQGATTVASVSGLSAASVASGASAANAATSTAATGKIVLRDSNGDFSAGVITAASFNGNAQTANTASYATTASYAAVAGAVSGASSTGVINAVAAVSAATSASGTLTLVMRDSGGNFTAGSITAALNGNASTASFATTAGSANTATSAFYATSAGTASSAAYATSAGTASSAAFATTASYATLAATATSAAFATTASYATSAGTASIATFATTAGSASSATTANYATSATSFLGSLFGDVTGTQNSTSVAFVGSLSAANVASGASAANAATSTAATGKIVLRDSNGDFSAGAITATSFNGNALTANTASYATTAGYAALAGAVSGANSTEVVSTVAAVSAATSASGTLTLVMRDSAGNFTANSITAALNGNASTASFATTSGSANTATSALYATSAGIATSASYATQAGTATSSSYATTAGSASSATTANYATSATSFLGSLFGDVTGTQNSTSVAFVGSLSAANVASGASAANAATSTAATGKIVLRDSNGDFSAGVITATSFSGNALTANTASYATTASYAALAGAVSGANSTEVVSTVAAVSAATSASGVSTLVMRDSAGGFSSGIITAALNGNASTASFATTAGSANTAASALYATSAGIATSASYATQAGTATSASYATFSGTASSASYATFSASATTASYATLAASATTASYATMAGTATTASYATMAGTATTASFATQADTATNAAYATSAGTASSAAFATTASYATLAATATSAAFATTASYATSAGTASIATFATTAGSASSATTANYATSATSFLGSLFGDVTGTQNSTSVAFVGSLSAANVASGASAANAATSTAATGKIVLRDSNGDFSAGVITAASFNGNALTASTASYATTAGYATVAGAVSGASSTGVINAVAAVSAATSTSGTLTLVMRDSTGNFTANSITAALNGNASTASFATTAGSANTATSALYATSAGIATSASYATLAASATTASYATMAGTATTASFATQADTATNAAYATSAGTASSAAFATTASYATLAATATSAAFATTASYATSAGTASIATFATTAGSASSATTANYATSATSFLGSLFGDVTGTQNSTSVAFVGSLSAANVASGASAANAATSTAATGKIVLRDSNGDFSAGVITATSFNGNALTANTASYATTADYAALAGGVSGVSSSNLLNAVATVGAATSASGVSTLVMRDSAGGFSSGIITAALNGNASTASFATTAGSANTATSALYATNAGLATTASYATNASAAVSFTGVLSGDVTGTQGATVVSSVSPTAISGLVPVSKGGTNASSVTANGVVYGGAGGTSYASVPGSSGQVLIAASGGTPTFTNTLSGLNSVTASGTITGANLVGALSGAVTAPTGGLTVGANQLVVTATGVGIGTTGPTAPLSVVGNAYISGTLTAGSFAGPISGTNGSYTSGLSVGGSGITVSAGGVNITGGINANDGGITNAGALAGVTTITASTGLTLASSGANSMSFATSGATAMTITSGGNVGIGTTAPAYLTDIRNATGITQFHVSGSGNDNGVYLNAVMSGPNTNGSFAVDAIWNGTNWIAKSPSASIIHATNGTVTINSNTGLTTGTSYTPTARMAILANGNVGIGTTTPGEQLSVANLGSFGGLVGVGYLAGGTTGTNVSPRQYANFGANGNGSVILSSNLQMDSTAPTPNLKVALTHPTISGAGITIPGNAETRQNFIQFWTTPPTGVTAGAAYAQANPRMVIDPTGNVGIGTTAPSNPLSVVGNANFSGTVTATAFSGTHSGTFSGTNGVYSSGLSVGGTGITTSGGLVVSASGASITGGINANSGGITNAGAVGGLTTLTGTSTLSLNTTGANAMSFATNGSTRMTIDSSGKVGIGTTTLPTAFTLNAARWVPLAGYQGVASFYSTDALGAGVGGGIILGGKFEAAQDPTEFAQLAGVKENSTSGDYAGNLVLSTRANGGSLVEAMRINSSGYVGIGTSAPTVPLTIGTAGSALNEGIRLNGNTAQSYMTFYNGAARVGYLGTSNSGTSMIFNSDGANGMNLWSNAGGMTFTNGSLSPFIFVANGAYEVMRISGNGTVGINTASPVEWLHVAGAIKATGASMSNAANSTGLDFSGSSRVIAWGANASTRGAFSLYQAASDGSLGNTPFYVSTTGNVGIGNTSPSSALHVIGVVTASSGFSGTFSGTSGSFSSGLTVSSGGASISGGLNNNSGGITNAGGLSGLTALTGTGALTLAAGGTAQNLTLSSSTTGSVDLGTGSGGTQVSVLNTTSAVNFITLTGAITGASPVIGTAGSDANVNLTFTPKGTGNTIFGSGKVGIGTAAPTARFEVRYDGDTSTGGTPLFQVINAGGGFQDYSGINFITGVSGSPGSLYKNSAANTGYAGASSLNLGTFGAENLGFHTSNLTRMMISSGGNVGIATTTPNFPLQVVGNVGIGPSSMAGPLQVTAGRSYLSIEGPTEAGVLELSTGLADANGARVGAIQFTDKNSIGADRRIGFFGASLEGTTANNRGGMLQFYLKADGVAGISERMRLSQNGSWIAGNVGIGTTNSSQRLTVTGAATAINQGVPVTSGTGSTATIRMNGGVGGEVLDVGVNVSPSYVWLQATNNGNLATNYSLLLNPNGGSVGIGTTAPSSALHVSGTVTATAFSGSFSGSNGVYSSGLSVAGTGISTSGGLVVSASGASITGGINANSGGITNAGAIGGLSTLTGSTTLSLNTTGANPMTFATSGSTRMTISSAGSVGIGITTPSGNLHVASTLLVSDPAGTVNTLRFTGSGGINYIQSGPNQTAGGAPLYFSAMNGASPYITFTGGNIGIGTTGPLNKLDVVGGAAIGSYAGVNTAPSNGLIVSGSVGIGTTSPGVSLDVAGGLRAGTSASVTACGSGAANGEGTQRFNYTNHSMEYCNGTNWVSVGNAGGLVFVGTQTPVSNVIEFTGLSSYSTYFMDCSGIEASAGSQILYLQIGDPTLRTTQYNWSMSSAMASGGNSNSYSTGGTSTIGVALTAARVGTGSGSLSTKLYISNFNSTTRVKNVDAQTSFGGDNGWSELANAEGYYYGSTNAASVIRLSFSSANITAGQCSLYGLNTSGVATTVASTGSGTTNYVPKWTSSTALGDSSIAVSGSNVGIGTTTPGEVLQVAGAVKVTGTGATNVASAGSLDYLSGNTRIVTFGPNTTTKGGFNVTQVSSDASVAGVPFTISPSGNVGIGTTTPGGPLHIVTSTISGNYFDSYWAGASDNSLQIRRGRGTSSSPATLINGDYIGSIYWGGHDGSTFVAGASINGLVNGTVSSGSVPTEIAFRTGTGAGGTERVRISSNGGVGIGTTSPSGGFPLTRACPTGWTDHGGFCASPVQTAAAFHSVACAANFGARACNVQEYYAIGSTSTCSGGQCWTDTACGGLQGLMVNVGVEWTCMTTYNTYNYKCCMGKH